MHGIFQGYRRLYERAQVLQSDISLDDLKYCHRDGQIIGSMAIDLLVPHPPAHLYRHDVESLFWIVKSYHYGKSVDKPSLRAWKHLGVVALEEKKRAFLLSSLPPHTENFTLVAKKWIRPCIGERVSRDPEAEPPFDDATLGGHVTFDKFAEILNQEF
ncbi:hypothetical protein FB451DRAFT_1360391 [Mycena latifolia]|nr:hypothetical protein FB451DRAFT_1360391 [Mycena latifolia]